MANQDDFLLRLQAEAAKQSKLHQQRLLPSQFDALTSLVGRYPWQACLVLSGVTAAVFWWVKQGGG